MKPGTKEQILCGAIFTNVQNGQTLTSRSPVIDCLERETKGRREMKAAWVWMAVRSVHTEYTQGSLTVYKDEVSCCVNYRTIKLPLNTFKIQY